MNSWRGVLAAWTLAGLASSNAALASQDAEQRATADARADVPETRASILTLTEGTVGGIVGPVQRRRVTIGYDWNRRIYRAVEWRGHQGVRRAELSAAEFVAFLEVVKELGLLDLPVEEPRESQDIYGLDTTISLRHEGRGWRNGAPGGCLHRESSVQPSAADIDVFREVVAHVDRTLYGLQFGQGSALDEHISFVPASHVARYVQVIEHLSREGLLDRVDLNRVVADPRDFTIALRELQQSPQLLATSWREYVAVSMTPDGSVAFMVRALAKGESYEERRSRREAFVRDHPELSVNHKELILAGWIEAGMTPEMVTAVLGRPSSTRHGEGGRLRLEFDPWYGHPSSVDFQDGLLRSFSPLE